MVQKISCNTFHPKRRNSKSSFLTHTDQTDLLAQFMLDHVKLCDHCIYICMAWLNKRATEPVFSIAQNHNVLQSDISGRIHPDPVKPKSQISLIQHGTLLPQNELPQQLPAQPQPVQQQLQMQQHFSQMQQMAQHHFMHPPHFIAQIHLQFVVPVAQLIFAHHGDNTTPQQVPQQPAKQQSVPN